MSNELANHQLRESVAVKIIPKYFKHWAESDLGEGVVLMEAVGDQITRQVEIYGSVSIWCDQDEQSDNRFMLADQPLSQLALGADDEIPALEFEEAWKNARVA
jgi:hypothetical protein